MTVFRGESVYNDELNIRSVSYVSNVSSFLCGYTSLKIKTCIAYKQCKCTLPSKL